MFNNSTGIPVQGQPPLDPWKVYFFCTLNTLISVLAIIGNTAVLMAFFKSSKIRTHQTNYFIASLAVADLISGCIPLPLWTYQIAEHFSSYYGHDKTLYYIYQTFDVFSVSASIYHLMFISLERYFAIVWPVMHHLATSVTYGIVLTMIWGISLASSGATVKASKAFRLHYPIFNNVILYSLPLLVILFSYSSILRTTLKRTHSTNRRSLDREIKVSFTIFILIALFVATWTPFFILSVIQVQCPACFTDITMVLTFKSLHFSNSACNPVVYAARIPDFKKAFSKILPKTLFKILWCRKETLRESPPTSRARTCSSMSVQTAMIEVCDAHSKRSRRRPTLLEEKPAGQTMLPQESVKSTAVSVSPERLTSHLSDSPSPLSGFQLTSV